MTASATLWLFRRSRRLFLRGAFSSSSCNCLFRALLLSLASRFCSSSSSCFLSSSSLFFPHSVSPNQERKTRPISVLRRCQSAVNILSSSLSCDSRAPDGMTASGAVLAERRVRPLRVVTSYRWLWMALSVLRRSFRSPVALSFRT